MSRSKTVRHGRTSRQANARSDLWIGLTAAAVGLSLLSDQWSDVKIVALANVPLFTIVIVNICSWIRSRMRRREADR